MVGQNGVVQQMTLVGKYDLTLQLVLIVVLLESVVLSRGPETMVVAKSFCVFQLWVSASSLAKDRQ